jgi:glucose uptake protein
MIAALWGVFVWDEFEEAPQIVNVYISLMFVCFIAGLGLIVWSRVA